MLFRSDVLQPVMITFDSGNYRQVYTYNPGTGEYDYGYVVDDTFLFQGGSYPQSGGSYGPYLTGYWGKDYSMALYSHGYDYGNSQVEVRPVDMTRVDGSTFSIDAVNITSYDAIGPYYGATRFVETVTGYLAGIQVAQESFEVPDANYTGLQIGRAHV